MLTRNWCEQASVCSLMPRANFLQEKKKMKFRKLIPGLVLGLMIAVSGVGFAQNASQPGNKKMDSCCCCSDSCAMKKDGAMKNHVTSSDKHECGCCGDSCPMMKKDSMKNHATSSSDKHDCCCGDSCSMMKDGAKKDAAAKSDKHECCGGDSCNMKDMKDKP